MHDEHTILVPMEPWRLKDINFLLLKKLLNLQETKVRKEGHLILLRLARWTLQDGLVMFMNWCGCKLVVVSDTDV